MNLQKLINELNRTLTNIFGGQKFEDGGSLQNEVISKTNALLDMMKLDLECEARGIHLKGKYFKVIDYNIDFTQDKRYRHQSRGRVNEIKFKPLIDMNQDATLEDLIVKLTVRDANFNIKRLKKEKEVLLKALEDIDSGVKYWEEKLEKLSVRKSSL